MIIFNLPDGATPLELDELEALIPKHIRTQKELNAWEEANILIAQQWGFNKDTQISDILGINFIRELHQHMFNMTWKWAGQFRHTEKNIGIHWLKIATSIKQLCDNVSYQLGDLDNQSFSKDEIVIRFHHNLTWIHPFPNGNGRHARLITDILIEHLGDTRFSWGLNQLRPKEEKNLYGKTKIRDQYIMALRKADEGDYSDLLTFSRS